MIVTKPPSAEVCTQAEKLVDTGTSSVFQFKTWRCAELHTPVASAADARLGSEWAWLKPRPVTPSAAR